MTQQVVSIHALFVIMYKQHAFMILLKYLSIEWKCYAVEMDGESLDPACNPQHQGRDWWHHHHHICR